MNQILDHSGPKKKATSAPRNTNDIRKIILVFSVIMLVFGIALIGNGVVGIASDKNKKDDNLNKEPVITITNNNDNLTISVVHNKAIEKVSYKWDDGVSTEIKGNGSNEVYVDDNIGVIAGEHVFTVTVLDVSGEIFTHQENYYSEKGRDTVKPTIDVQYQNSNEKPTVTVIAKDETALSYITVSVDGKPEGEPIYPEEGGDQKKIEYTFEVESDRTSYTIVAVDTSNNQFVKTNVNILKTPKIDLYVENNDLSKVYVHVTSELGINRVEYDLNGENVYQDFENPGDYTDFTFYIPTVQGENNITVRAYPPGSENVPELVGVNSGSITK